MKNKFTTIKRHFVFILALIVTITTFSNIPTQAGQKKHSIYSYASNLSRVYPAARILKDNRGYYFTYNNNGYFECYLGKSSTMYFKDFAKCLGGNTNTVIKKRK